MILRKKDRLTLVKVMQKSSIGYNIREEIRGMFGLIIKCDDGGAGAIVLLENGEEIYSNRHSLRKPYKREKMIFKEKQNRTCPIVRANYTKASKIMSFRKTFR